ncbi:MAG TPA: amidohydrolase family protein [Terriglobia bacterium]|nr:amidohydrolase family protein [Terriglobia bacterium]
MIFDAHLHLSSWRGEGRRSPDLVGGLVISRAASENERYIQAAERLGLQCAVFAGGTKRDLEQVLRWIEQGQAFAYDHVELLERFAARDVYPTFEASRRAGRALVLHLSRHDRGRTSPGLVRGCLDYLTENFPELKVIIAHVAGENCRTALEFAEWNQNLFFDVSKLAQTSERLGVSSPVDLLKALSDAVPASRIVFGTDQIGLCGSASSVEYAAVAEVFTEADSVRVLAHNAMALFGAHRPPLAEAEP